MRPGRKPKAKSSSKVCFPIFVASCELHERRCHFDRTILFFCTRKLDFPPYMCHYIRPISSTSQRCEKRHAPVTSRTYGTLSVCAPGQGEGAQNPSATDSTAPRHANGSARGNFRDTFRF